MDESVGKVPRETDIAGGGGQVPEPTESTPTHPIAPVPGPQGQLVKFQKNIINKIK